MRVSHVVTRTRTHAHTGESYLILKKTSSEAESSSWKVWLGENHRRSRSRNRPNRLQYRGDISEGNERKTNHRITFWGFDVACVQCGDEVPRSARWSRRARCVNCQHWRAEGHRRSSWNVTLLFIIKHINHSDGMQVGLVLTPHPPTPQLAVKANFSNFFSSGRIGVQINHVAACSPQTAKSVTQFSDALWLISFTGVSW